MKALLIVLLIIIVSNYEHVVDFIKFVIEHYKINYK